MTFTFGTFTSSKALSLAPVPSIIISFIVCQTLTLPTLIPDSFILIMCFVPVSRNSFRNHNFNGVWE